MDLAVARERGPAVKGHWAHVDRSLGNGCISPDSVVVAQRLRGSEWWFLRLVLVLLSESIAEGTAPIPLQQPDSLCRRASMTLGDYHAAGLAGLVVPQRSCPESSA